MHAFGSDPPPGARKPSQVTLREAAEGDEHELLHLWRELMDFHVQVDPRFQLSDDADERFLQYLDTARARDDYRVTVADYRGRVVGFVIACILPNSPVYRARWVGYINDLVVTRGLRRQGVGEQLVADAVEWLLDTGAESVEVYVARHNPVAQSFWRRIGAGDYLDRMSVDLSRFRTPRG